MIVFVDGIDGSGKTTLIQNVTRALNETGTGAQVSEPLWQHLTAIDAPEEFVSWVTRTDKTEVATALLRAKVSRVNSLQEASRQTSVLLVDRGRKTVHASAFAHAGVHSPKLAVIRALLERSVDVLLAQTSCMAVEITACDALAVTLPRLRRLQNIGPQYLQYLKAFAREMRMAPDWPGLPARRLDIRASAEHNSIRLLTELPLKI